MYLLGGGVTGEAIEWQRNSSQNTERLRPLCGAPISQLTHELILPINILDGISIQRVQRPEIIVILKN